MSLKYQDNEKNMIVSKALLEEAEQKLNFFKRLLNTKESAVFEKIKSSLEKVFISSDFIYKNFLKNPHNLKWAERFCNFDNKIGFPDYDKSLASILSDNETEESFAKKIRIFRIREAVKIGFADIIGRFDLFDVVQRLSALADAIIGKTLECLYERQCLIYGRPQSEREKKQLPVILGMGKLGGKELNFSSDIDLVFAYPEDGETNGEKETITNKAFFTKLFTRLIDIIDKLTEDGFAFRVDMRLRPYGENGPIVMSFEAMEDYYQTQGREWERYAFIKARVCAGDKEEGIELLKTLRPFIYRKYLDYGTIESLRDMKGKIDSEAAKKGFENNIKLGKGGIREVEFFGQIFQLIRGGIDTDLQKRDICSVIKLLKQKKYIKKEVSDSLVSAYIFLRNTEHRLQEFADAGIHTIPAEPKQLLRLAYSLDFEDASDFLFALNKHRENVGFYFSTLLFPEKNDAKKADNLIEKELKHLWENLGEEEETLNILQRIGYEKPDKIYRLLKGLNKDILAEAVSVKGKARLVKLIPALLIEAANSEKPEITLKPIFALIKTIIKRTCYLSLFLENHSALKQLIKLANASSWIISLLTKYPLLLDELIDHRTLYSPPQKADLKKELDFRISRFAQDDIEKQMDEARIFKRVNMLRVAAAEVADIISVKEASYKLCGIADVILEKILDILWKQLVERYGAPNCEIKQKTCDKGFVAIAYGKLGGEEISYGSDLDIVFLHSGKKGGTLGEDSIDNSTFFSRLGQRTLHFLSSRTSAGILYETDMRLRPSGASGLLVSHIDSFQEYQKNQAWTWEHQALVRARSVAGNRLLCKQFNLIRKIVLCKKRDKEKLAKDIIDMRLRVRTEKMYKKSDKFDLKQGFGGIVDIEFLIQYLVLLNAFFYPEILEDTSNIKFIRRFEKIGILSGDYAKALKKGYIEYKKAIHRLNLAEKKGLVKAEDFKIIRKEVIKIWEYFLGGFNI
ncbi:MAG: bifunctional [glutamate--ammonia ligase]-adenylyl-L-tyrosine phosphorylase/[glutamate--ammonia-ligase] adenylyltransferase [Deltaproteobacteria bacterium]|nr:bifunctional [glutamate--ammonia ligase]-adenylyl-L-tyrosine phosphorylase/[glutamate--ammonia-ligase] adenylyltransferase [Deltaproteobacteria bacterium]